VPEPTAALMRPYALLYVYRRRVRAHGVQELLAGVGVAAAVALIFAVTVASSSVAGSTGEVIRAVVGHATLQVRANGPDGFSESLLGRVERLPGVKQAAPLLEQTATIDAPDGRQVTLDIAGADFSLTVLDGLAHTLPISVLATPGIGLTRASAAKLGITPHELQENEVRGVVLKVHGRAFPLKVTAVLGPEAAGALSQAVVALMPLEHLQQAAGLRGRISRVLVQSQPGRERAVRAELARLTAGAMTVAPADQDLTLLRRALGPSNLASAIFAAIAGLLGFLFAFNAILLTVPERRRAIADLRLSGTRRSAIVQMVAFQAVCLGLAASVVGVLGGYALSVGLLHQSAGYLSEAFALGANTVVGVLPIILAVLGGVLASCAASSFVLLDLRRGRALDAAYHQYGEPGNELAGQGQLHLAIGIGALVVAASALFALAPSLALAATAVLAVATILAVPLAFAGTLRLARALTHRLEHLTSLPVALTALKATTLRSLALSATGAVALFGAVSLGGARTNLLEGLKHFASTYNASADIWVLNQGDPLAVDTFAPDSQTSRIQHTPGVANVKSFQSQFLNVGDRRVWMIARPAGSYLHVLERETVAGDPRLAAQRLSEGGWVTVSEGLASEQHVGVAGTLTLPTPTGNVSFRIAAMTTNFGWSPGAIMLNSADYSRYWQSTAPSALGVTLTRAGDPAAVEHAVNNTLGPASGLEAVSATARATRFDSIAAEGLGQLQDISNLLVLAAILALAAALGSAIWQRRPSLAALRLAGARPHRLRRILLIESALMLTGGCLTGVVGGLYGQIIIDGYLKHVTGFPVASVTASWRPLEILAFVMAVVLAIVAIPGWFASRVPPALALEDE
jgi:putative ABC transport system permease protein